MACLDSYFFRSIVSDYQYLNVMCSSLLNDIIITIIIIVIIIIIIIIIIMNTKYE